MVIKHILKKLNQTFYGIFISGWMGGRLEDFQQVKFIIILIK